MIFFYKVFFIFYWYFYNTWLNLLKSSAAMVNTWGMRWSLVQ